MMKTLVIKLVSVMTEESRMDESQYEQYIYILVLWVESMITIGSILCISVILQVFIPSIVFLFIFLSLRKRTGGFHAESFFKCFCWSIIIYIVVFVINTALHDKQQLFLWILFPAVCMILIIGTVNHPNVCMDFIELKQSKRKARRLAGVYGFVIFLISYRKIDLVYIGYMSTAVIVCAVMLCLGKLLKQEVKDDEEYTSSITKDVRVYGEE